MLKLKKENQQTIQTAGEDMKKLEPSSMADEFQECSHFGKQLATSHKVKHILNIQINNSTPTLLSVFTQEQRKHILIKNYI